MNTKTIHNHIVTSIQEDLIRIGNDDSVCQPLQSVCIDGHLNIDNFVAGILKIVVDAADDAIFICDKNAHIFYGKYNIQLTFDKLIEKGQTYYWVTIMRIKTTDQERGTRLQDICANSHFRCTDGEYYWTCPDKYKQLFALK